VTGDAPLNPTIETVARRNDRPTQGVLVSALWNGTLIRLLWIAGLAGKHRRKHGLNRSRSAGERNLVRPNAKFDPGSRNINAQSDHLPRDRSGVDVKVVVNLVEEGGDKRLMMCKKARAPEESGLLCF
jgi:hypothetical protein